MKLPKMHVGHVLDVNKDMKRSEIREKLDAARTKLANERTLLSYVRTSLALIVAGITFIRFFDYQIIVYLGWSFLPIGVINFILGVIRYHTTRDHINEIDHL